MTWDPLSLSTIQLLARGHNLYGADYFDAGVVDAPAQLRRRLQQLASVNSAEGIGAAALANLRMAAGLGHNAAAEGELDGVLADAPPITAWDGAAHGGCSTTPAVTRCPRRIPRSDDGKHCTAWRFGCASSGTISTGRIRTRTCSPGG